MCVWVQVGPAYVKGLLHHLLATLGGLLGLRLNLFGKVHRLLGRQLIHRCTSGNTERIR
jgi:hypothetical protein